jgi:anti-sigma factor ChrR (cupin superfamily)
LINMDFSKTVVIDTSVMDWVTSPAPGVWRKPLARAEAERGHATSIVRYEAGASFRRHDHPLGEEILVLDGVFSDESGDYGAGTYFRNPEGFRHAPFSKEGCVILVKLHQFQSDDHAHVSIETHKSDWQYHDSGFRTLELHRHRDEIVMLVDWPAGGKNAFHNHPGGEELYVLSGELGDENYSYPAGTWARHPHMSGHAPYANVDTLLWLKLGHLPK